MTISVGQALPEASFHTLTAEGPKAMTTGDIFKGKTVALFAVPGAFTPTCHVNHMPGYVGHYDDFLAKGVDCVACVSVNDFFVMKAWADASGADGKILMLSDDYADFSKAIGLELDLTGAGLGVRSQRYSMIVRDGVVSALNVEADSTKMVTSAAKPLLDQI